MLIRSSRYVLGARPVIVDRLRLLLESAVLSLAVDGRTSGESGGVGSVRLDEAYTPDWGRDFDLRSPGVPIEVIPVPPPGEAVLEA